MRGSVLRTYPWRSFSEREPYAAKWADSLDSSRFRRGARGGARGSARSGLVTNGCSGAEIATCMT